MTTNNIIPKCPICLIEQKATRNGLLPSPDEIFRVNCPLCGVFDIMNDAFSDLLNKNVYNRHLYSAWLYKHTNKNSPFKIVEAKDVDEFNLSSLPQTVTEKKKALLLALAKHLEDNKKYPTDIIHLKHKHFISAIAAVSYDEVCAIVKLLDSDALLKATFTVAQQGDMCNITSLGWEKIDSYRLFINDGKNCFYRNVV